MRFTFSHRLLLQSPFSCIRLTFIRRGVGGVARGSMVITQHKLRLNIQNYCGHPTLTIHQSRGSSFANLVGTSYVALIRILLTKPTVGHVGDQFSIIIGKENL